jgi:Tfp pilus assembly protein PilF
MIAQGRLDAALAKLQEAGTDPEALYLQGVVWAKKAESVPLPTPAPLASPLPQGATPPPAPEFKEEERTAIELFEKALSARPELSEAHLSLADLLAPHALGRLERDRAREAAAQAAARKRRRGGSVEPVPPPPAEGPEASVDRVIREYRLAAQTDPASTVAVEALIRFSERTGRLEDADAGFQEFLKRERERPDPYMRYGDFLANEKKDPMGAVTQYEQALIWRPDDEEAKGKIADIYLGLGLEHMSRHEWASAQARFRDAQRYVTDKSSARGQKLRDNLDLLAQIRRPPGR